MKKKLKITNQSPSEIFSQHAKKFLPFKEELLTLYSDYPNKQKIVTLLDYWIFNILALKETYGEDGLISFCDSDFNNAQRFSFLYETSNQEIGFPLHQGEGKKIIFFTLKFFIKMLFIPGARLKWFGAKILNKISIYFIQSIPANVNYYIQDEVFQIIDKILSENISLGEIKKVKMKLPKVFYSNIAKLPYKSQILVDGSCASFLEFSGIEKLFLLNNTLKIKGFQHGGGYDIFKIDYFADYEKRLSDEFYGWGFSKHNIHQPKFQKLKTIKSDEKRILWIEDSFLPTFYFTSMPYHYYQSINVSTKFYIYTELKKELLNYSSLYHPRSKSSLYEGLREDYYLISGSDASEKLIRQSDILIFDNAGATLLHFAIENNIIFYLVISRGDFTRFTCKHREFFNLLRKYGFGLYNDEDSNLVTSVLKIMETNNYYTPLEMVSFYKQNFFDCKP